MRWENLHSNMDPRKFTCGFCNCSTGSKEGYYTNGGQGFIYICQYCARPTFFEADQQTPAPIVGSPVQNLTTEVRTIYEEARLCTGCQAFTATVLLCRKLLMHIAVERGAEPNKTFLSYVEYLSSHGYVPPDGKEWVDHIREKGNEANHEIKAMSFQDAEGLLMFSEFLLKFMYEFPSKVSRMKTGSSSGGQVGPDIAAPSEASPS